MKQWDIWVVHWTHEDLTGKARPALLISGDAQLAAGGPRLFMKISRQQYPRVPDLALDRRVDGDEFHCTGLDVSPSFIHFTAIQAVDPGLIYKKIGHLGTNTVERLLKVVEAIKARHRRS